MVKSSAPAIYPALLIALLVTFPSRSLEAGIIEQNRGGGWSTFYYGPIGQSFVAEDSRIGTISFDFRNANPDQTNTPVTVTLYEGEGFSGSILHSVTQTLPDELKDPMDELYPVEFFNFDFSNIAVSIGSIYTVAAYTSSMKVGIRYNSEEDLFSQGKMHWQNTTSLTAYDMVFRITPGVVPPRLNIEKNSNEVVLSWTETSTQFLLQSIVDLNSQGWETVSGFHTNNGIISVSFPLVGTNRFYRMVGAP